MGNRLDELLKRVSDEDSVVRGEVAQQLGELEGEYVVQTLVRLLEDRDVIVRFKAAQELAFKGNDQGLPVLVWALRRSELCFMALEAMIHLESPACREEVKRFFGRWFLHPLERMQAAAVLHRCGDTEGTQFLGSKLNSKKPEERGFAIELWGKLHMPDALKLLHGILMDPADGQRLDAVRGLEYIRDQSSLPLLDKVALQKEDPELAKLAGEVAAAFRRDLK